MLLRYEWVGTREVVDYQGVDLWGVVGPSGLEVVGYGYIALENSTEVRRVNTYEQEESGRG
jgi:hypothetical protein